jgi:hypothetical protein
MKAAALALATVGIVGAGVGILVATTSVPDSSSPMLPDDVSVSDRPSEEPSPMPLLSPNPPLEPSASSVQAGVPSPNLPSTLAAKMAEVETTVRSRTAVAMLMPDWLPEDVLEEAPFYLSQDSATDHYSIVLGLTPDCHANVCSAGSISAERGGAPYPEEFSDTVPLIQDIQGYFQPMTCGASCSPPVIGWAYEGAFYRIYLKMDGSEETVRARMIDVANSAIAHDAR